MRHRSIATSATLEETKESELLLQIIDASHPTWEELRMVVEVAETSGELVVRVRAPGDLLARLGLQ